MKTANNEGLLKSSDSISHLSGHKSMLSVEHADKLEKKDWFFWICLFEVRNKRKNLLCRLGEKETPKDPRRVGFYKNKEKNHLFSARASRVNHQCPFILMDSVSEWNKKYKHQKDLYLRWIVFSCFPWYWDVTQGQFIVGCSTRNKTPKKCVQKLAFPFRSTSGIGQWTQLLPFLRKWEGTA